MTSLDTLRSDLDEPTRAWLVETSQKVTADPSLIGRVFPAVTRNVSAGSDDAVRMLLLAALGEAAVEEIPNLYRFGDVNEKRAILRSFNVLSMTDVYVDIARDAFRTNDPRLVVAAASAPVVERLTADEVDQAVMKCVFMDIPLASVPDLVARSRAETSRMLAGFVLERVTAGRTIAADVWNVIDRFPPQDLLDAVAALQNSTVDEQREAARAALSLRTKELS